MPDEKNGDLLLTAGHKSGEEEGQVVFQLLFWRRGGWRGRRGVAEEEYEHEQGEKEKKMEK